MIIKPHCNILVRSPWFSGDFLFFEEGVNNLERLGIGRVTGSHRPSETSTGHETARGKMVDRGYYFRRGLQQAGLRMAAVINEDGTVASVKREEQMRKGAADKAASQTDISRQDQEPR